MTIHVLVIDDELGRIAYRREEFLSRWNLFPDSAADCPLEYTFITSQLHREDRIDNDAMLAVDFVAEDPDAWALVLLDMQFDHGPLLHGEPVDADPQFGLRIHTALEQRFPSLPIVHFSAQPQKDLQRQDSHYLSKMDGTLDDLRLTLVERGRLSLADKRRLLRIPTDTIIASESMIGVYAQVYRRARADTPLLIRGETGTGKEHLARYFHAVSPHASGELVAVQVSTIPSELYESELFGHEKGAFTGADKPHDGVFVRAASGTLLLDEIGTLPQTLQAKLLRVLGERVFRKVGSTTDRELRCGVVAATQDDLEATGFRQDLLARFGSVTISPLRERPDEVLPLAEYFLARSQQRDGKRGIVLSEEAKDALVTGAFPDNARGVKAAIERAVLNVSSNSVIQPRHLGLSGRDRISQAVTMEPSEPAIGSNRTVEPLPDAAVSATWTLSDLFVAIREVGVPAQVEPLRGVLERCEESFSTIRREIVLAALQSCRHPVSGKIRVLPAMQLITDDPSLTPIRARRKLNDILGRNQRETLDLADLETELAARFGDADGDRRQRMNTLVPRHQGK